MAKNIYTTQFYTKVETDSKITQSAENIDLSVNQKLSNYSTTTEMNSAINIKANEITSSVSETYATKTTTNTLSSRISQTAKSISLQVNNGSTTSGIVIGITKEDGTTSEVSGTIEMTGLVKFTDLSGSGTTTINGANIQTGTITATKLATNSITTEKISANSITADKIANATITNAKIVNSTITGSKLADVTITNAKIADATITNAKIADATITNAKIANINANKITAGTINADRIATNSITANKLNITSLSSVTANMGTITSGQISSDRAKLNLSSGYIQMFPSDGGSFIFNGAGRMSAVYGVGISSNSNGNVTAPSNYGIDIKACSLASVYLGCMTNSTGTTERHGIVIYSGGISMSTTPSYGSDIRLKDKIKEIEDVSWIDELKIKEYEYKNAPGEKKIGLIAQDYLDKEYAKYFLKTDIKGMYCISYTDIANALIQYCQELKKKINELEEIKK